MCFQCLEVFFHRLPSFSQKKSLGRQEKQTSSQGDRDPIRGDSSSAAAHLSRENKRINFINYCSLNTSQQNTIYANSWLLLSSSDTRVQSSHHARYSQRLTCRGLALSTCERVQGPLRFASRLTDLWSRSVNWRQLSRSAAEKLEMPRLGVRLTGTSLE